MNVNDQNINKVIQNRIEYSLDDRDYTAAVVGDHYYEDEELLIPRSIIYKSKEYIVTKIAELAISNSIIKLIHFACDSEIKTIERDAFCNASIETIIIPSSLTELKQGWCNSTNKLIHIFVDTNNLRYKVYENKYIIGKSLVEHDNYDVLVFCVRNIETAIIPDFIEKISTNSFDGCIKLRHIQFSNNSKLKIIENSAFSNSSIESIVIPSGAIDINDDWCDKTSKLTKITVMPNNPRYFVYDEKYLFCKSSIDKDNYDTLLFCVRDIKDVLIPDFIEIIGSSAFEDCYCMKSISFSAESNLKIIQKYAFFNCNIRTISIPASVQKISEYAFGSCNNLIHVDIPANSELKIIEKYAFMNSSIEEILIPSCLIELKESFCPNLCLKKITVMPDNQYYFVYDEKYLLGKSSSDKENNDVLLCCMRSIERVIIPDFIEIIDSYAFGYYQNLEIEISANSKLRIIGKNAFYNSSIKNIYIPSSVIEIKEDAFCLCRNLKNVEIPNDSNLKIINKNAFADTSIEKFTIPTHLQEIGQFSFENCTKLKCIIIPENSELKIIEKGAFQYTSIESISIPPNLIKIEKNAFYFCQNLKEFIIPENSKLQKIGSRAFYGTMIESLLIPQYLTELEEGWCEHTPQLKNITILPNNPCYSMDEDLLIIEKSTINSLIFCVRDISYVIIPDYIEIISPYSFYGCKDLQEIIIPNDSKLRIIEKFAFAESSLKRILIPFQLEEIKEGAFFNCNNFSSIFIPFNSRLRTVERFAFYNTSINYFSIPPSLVNLNILWCIRAIQRLKKLNYQCSNARLIY